MSRFMAFAAVLAAAGTFAATATAGSHHVTFPSKCTNEAYKPSGIVAACGDNGVFLKKLDWKKWTSEEAEGNGVAHVNTCKPSCAAGHFKRAAAHVRLSKPQRCGAVRQFTKLRIHFESSVPGPQRQTFPFPLGCE